MAKRQISIKSRVLAAAMTAVLALLTMLSPAAAQQVVALVGGSPITTYDIEQRSKLIQLSTHKAASRQEVLEELVNDRVKILEAKRYGVEATNAEIDNTIAAMGSRMRMNVSQFSQALAAGGVRLETLKARVKAEIAWSQIVRGRFGSSIQVDEKDVNAALQTKKQSGDSVAYNYTLRPVLFIVAKDSPAGSLENRMRDAEALRTRFQSCDEGIAFARGLRDVAVREPVTKTSADLAPALREILDNTAVGHLTKPEVTPQGVELFALCEKKETTSDTPQKRGIRDEILSSRFEAQSKRYLAEARRSTMIEYK